MKAKKSANWDVKDVYNVFIATFIIALVLFVILNLIGTADYLRDISDRPYLKTLTVFGLYILQTIGIVFPLWFFAIRKRKIGLGNFGFRWIGTFKTIAWVIMSYIFYIGLATFIIVLFFNLGIGIFGFEPQTSIFDIFGANLLGIFTALIVAVFIAPFVEEIYFRGFVLQVLAKKISPFWGIVLTALIFAAVHFEFRSIIPLLILSLILNILYLRTKSIWPGIIFHMFNNSIAFTIALIFENQHWL